MSDIVADLRLALRGGMRAGTADSDVNVMLAQVPVVDVERAIAEIETLRADVVFLRSLAGGVTDGPSFREITKNLARRSGEDDSRAKPE